MKTLHKTVDDAPAARRRLGPVLAMIRPIFARYALRLALGFATLVGVDFLQLIIPRLLKTAVDSLAAGSATGKSLAGISGLILAAAVGAALLRFCWRYLIIGFSRLLERDIRNRIYSHVLKMDRSFFEKRTSGDIMAHISNDLQAVQMACGIGLVSAVDALVMSVAAISFMAYINPQLTLLALLPMPFLAVSTLFLTGRLHHRFNIVQEQFSLLTEFVRSTLVSIRLVKAYTMENMQRKVSDRLGKKYVRSNIRVAMIHGLLFPVAALVGNLGMLLVLYYGGRFAIEGRISLGDFVAFITYLYMLVWPMMAIGWVANLTQRGLTSLQRIHELTTSIPRLKDLADSSSPEVIDPWFRLQNLTFSYQSSSRPALQDLTMELRGGIYGITGRTGSGKSTLCQLLARLYPVPDGCLFFGSRDVNTLSLDTVRSRVAYVGQEAILFSDTIAENIAYGKPGATAGEIEAAAQKAAIHNEILDFPKGYGTTVGERGVTLSGGQRQRLALARALITDRSVLIIDDALAALDVETEHQVLRSIVSRQDRNLILIVSQRVKLLSETDRIFILEKGRLQDSGIHGELLARNSLYRTMNEKQARESVGRHVPVGQRPV
ncbi:MAG: ABC transporter ATP-binding protein/permease [Desulfobulbaceae bacterium]|nr:ABC transporter ATP-binding protein/permease [Desulfobulbaceae bacterium]